MDNMQAKVYIVVNKGMIESIYSEDGSLPVVVLDMDTLQEESDEVREEIEKWRDVLHNNAVSGGTLNEIEYWDAKEII